MATLVLFAFAYALGAASALMGVFIVWVDQQEKKMAEEDEKNKNIEAQLLNEKDNNK